MNPIIMGAESVRAILEGRKTQTRRVVKPQPEWFPEVVSTSLSGGLVWPITSFGGQCGMPLKQKYHIGDRLWVRESWKPGAWRNDGRVAIDYMASPELTHTSWIHMGDQADNYIPRWLNEISEIGLIPNQDGRYEWEPGKSPFKWKRAMYMPRFASRITLEITDIRVERLQDITEDDADAEIFGGYEPHSIVPEIFNINDVYKTITECFGKFWNSLNAKRGYPWESNPWVWVISFKSVHNQKEGV